MKYRLIFLFLFFLINAPLFGQTNFAGSFTMSFNSSRPEKDPPMLWNIDSVSRGGKMVFEIQDDMLKKGISKRVLFSPSDSIWTMMMEFNTIKQGTRVKGAAMYRDTATHRKVNTRPAKGKKIIDGYNCKKLIIENDSSTAELWYTDQIKFDLCRIYRLLSHCGLMSQFVRRGDWFFDKKIQSMVMEVTSKNKSTGETYTMSISGIKPGVIDTTHFTLNGFRISEIVEGQKCGVGVK